MSETRSDEPTDLNEYLIKVGHNLKGPIPKCIELADSLLMRCSNNLHSNQHVTAARLFQIGFGSWRSSVTLALAGASSAVPATLRHAHECSQYSYLCSRDSEFEEIWWNREFDSEAKASMRGRNGPIPRAKASLKKEDAALGAQMERTTQTLIDFGAHPNMLIFVDHSDSEHDLETETYTTKLLGSAEARNSAFVISCGVALDMARVFRVIWPIRFGMNCENLLSELIGQTDLFVRWHHSQDYS